MSDIETKLFLNAVMTLLNIFEPEACVKMMFYKVDVANWHKLKTVLSFLNRMPISIPSLKVYSQDIPECEQMINILAKI
jgi:hypothetical protein